MDFSLTMLQICSILNVNSEQMYKRKSFINKRRLLSNIRNKELIDIMVFSKLRPKKSIFTTL